MKHLLLFLLAVGIVWLALQAHHTTRHDPIDIAILVVLGSLYTMAVLVMLLGTASWTFRALGILGTMAGDAVFYGSLGLGNWGHQQIPEWLTDVARAFFIIGAPLFFLACLRWLHTRRTHGEGDFV